MSVRRLADDSVQPESFAFSRTNAAWAKRKLKDYPKGRQASAVIPLLMRAQEQEGWVSKPAIEHIALMLDMPLIRVLEVATFYTQFQLQPVGKRAHIQVCGTTPCMLRGSDALIALCKSHIAERPFDLSADGNMSWEEVECQGACVNAPMVLIGRDTYEDLTPRQFEHILDRFGAGRGEDIRPGPQVDRIYSAPEGGLTSLTEDPTAHVDRSVADGVDDASGPPATEAARPNAHAPVANPAVKTPVARGKAQKGQEEAEKKSSVQSVAAEAKHVDGSTRIATQGKVMGGVDVPADRPRKASAATKKAGQGASSAPAARSAGRTGVSGQTIQPLAGTGAKGSGKPADDRSPAIADGDDAAGATATPSRGTRPTKATTPKSAAGDAKPSLDSADRPPSMERPAEADDLKMISGVGPKIEGILHDLGIWTFAQIGQWQKAERDWVDGYLRFRGRIDRDDWVTQAQALARGGPEEYMRVFGKKPR